jgi:hypothetical protein
LLEEPDRNNTNWPKISLGYVERLAMRKKRLRGRLSMVRGTMTKIKISIYSKRKAPDSRSEGRNRRDTWRAGARGTGERKGGPTRGCVDSRA